MSGRIVRVDKTAWLHEARNFYDAFGLWIVGTEGDTYTGAPAVQLGGPSTQVGSEHYAATSMQRQAGGTYAAERRIGYRRSGELDLLPKRQHFLLQCTLIHISKKLGSMEILQGEP